jgi:hypothetical protein
MDDQTKILICMFSGISGLLVVISLSVFGHKKYKNTAKETKKDKKIKTGNVLGEIVANEVERRKNEEYSKIIDKKLEPVKKEHEERKKEQQEIKARQQENWALLAQWENNVKKGLQIAGSTNNAWDLLNQIKQDDEEIENEEDLNVQQAMIVVQLEELEGMKEELVGSNKDEEENDVGPSTFFTPNQQDIEIT